MILDEDLRKKMGEALEKGDSVRALELSQQLDVQILKYTKHKLQLISQDLGIGK